MKQFVAYVIAENNFFKVLLSACTIEDAENKIITSCNYDIQILNIVQY